MKHYPDNSEQCIVGYIPNEWYTGEKQKKSESDEIHLRTASGDKMEYIWSTATIQA